MAIEKRKQSTRLIFLCLYILLLFAINKLAFGSWLPESGDKGLWFYTAAASILLGNFLVTPFFTKPVDALSYAVMAGMERDHIQAFRIEATKSYFAITKLLKLENEVTLEGPTFNIKKEVLRCYEGRYSAKSGETFEIVVDENSLFVVDYGTKSELISLSPTKFMVQNALFTFTNPSNYDDPGIVFHINGQAFHYTKNE
jgi:hypothetical protein